MEKAALKKVSVEDTSRILKRMLQKSVKIVRTKGDKDGRMSELAVPTVIRTPDALPGGELTEAARASVYVEIDPSQPIVHALREPAVRRTEAVAGSSGAKVVATKPSKRPGAPISLNPEPRKVARTRASGRVARDRRERESSTSSEDRSEDLIHRKTGGKSPRVVAEALKMPSKDMGDLWVSELPLAVMESIEDEAVRAGSHRSPFSEEEYNRTLTAEIERRTAEKNMAAREKAMGKKKVSGEGADEPQLEKGASEGASRWGDAAEIRIGEYPEVTPFNVSLYPNASAADEVHDFVDATLVNGVHFPANAIREGAVLTMHATNWLIRAARAETQKMEERKAIKLDLQACRERLRKQEEEIETLRGGACPEKLRDLEKQVKELLAEREKLTNLVRGQAERLKQRDDQLDKASQVRTELTRKVEDHKRTHSLLNKTKLSLEEEKAAKSKLGRDLGDLKRTLQDVKEQAGRMARENALREAASHKELKRMKDAMVRLQEEKDGAVKAYRESSAFEEEILKAKRQAYYRGLEMNVATFRYYEVLDVETFEARVEDPSWNEAAPVAEYAQQWAHLPEDQGHDDGEDADEEIIMEQDPSGPVNNEVSRASEVVTLPGGQPKAPVGPEAGEEAIDPMPLSVMLPLPSPAVERHGVPEVQQSPPG